MLIVIGFHRLIFRVVVKPISISLGVFKQNRGFGLKTD